MSKQKQLVQIQLIEWCIIQKIIMHLYTLHNNVQFEVSLCFQSCAICVNQPNFPFQRNTASLRCSTTDD